MLGLAQVRRPEHDRRRQAEPDVRAVAPGRALAGGPQPTEGSGQSDAARDRVQQHHPGVADESSPAGGHRQPPVPPGTLTHQKGAPVSCSRYDVSTRILAVQEHLSLTLH